MWGRGASEEGHGTLVSLVTLASVAYYYGIRQIRSKSAICLDLASISLQWELRRAASGLCSALAGEEEDAYWPAVRVRAWGDSPQGTYVGRILLLQSELSLQLVASENALQTFLSKHVL